MKKKNILEIIDSNNNIIGDDDTPRNGANKETEASKTTDYNALVHGQNYKGDFLGRFGFYFYEGEEDKTKNFDIDIIQEISEWSSKILNKKTVNEVKIVEDKLTKKTEETLNKKNDNGEIKNKDINKIADLIGKLEKGDVSKLINLLEIKIK